MVNVANAFGLRYGLAASFLVLDRMMFGGRSATSPSRRGSRSSPPDPPARRRAVGRATAAPQVALRGSCTARRRPRRPGLHARRRGLASTRSAAAGRGRRRCTFFEVGAYCGKSGRLPGRRRPGHRHGAVLARPPPGPEENQAGGSTHESDLVDPAVGLMDTLPVFRRTILDAGLEAVVVAVGRVGHRRALLDHPLAFLFIDGGHGTEPAHRDYERWTPHVAPGGTLAIHDVFP